MKQFVSYLGCLKPAGHSFVTVFNSFISGQGCNLNRCVHITVLTWINLYHQPEWSPMNVIIAGLLRLAWTYLHTVFREPCGFNHKVMHSRAYFFLSWPWWQCGMPKQDHLAIGPVSCMHEMQYGIKVRSKINYHACILSIKAYGT